jgi:hypothetical protein
VQNASVVFDFDDGGEAARPIKSEQNSGRKSVPAETVAVWQDGN